MAKEIRVDLLPGTDKKAKIGKIKVDKAEVVSQGEVILILEGGKTTMEVKSVYEGKILTINVEEGQEVEKGSLLVTIEEFSGERTVNEIQVKKMPGSEKSAVVGKINVTKGQEIKKGDLIATIEGAKIAIDLESEVDGKIIEILIEEGQEVQLNTIVAKIESKKAGLVKKEKEEDQDKDDIADDYQAELVVLGGGPGGYVAAIRASQLGKSVIIVEEDALGGTCLNRGCIPTKSMVQSTKVNDLIKNAESFGIENASGNLSMQKIIDRKNSVVQTLVSGLNNSMQERGIRVLKGRAVANDKKSLLVTIGGKETIVSFDDLILAPGSIVSIPRFEGVDDVDILTSNELLDLTEIPESLIIMGGRVIAMEFAFIYRKLGSKVTVIQRSNTIFPSLDEDIIEVVRNSAIENGIRLVEGTNVKSIKPNIDGSKTVIFEQNGEEKFVTAQELAIATGRKPNLEGLGLEKLGVEISDKYKGIKVDDKMRTTAENIYAIGDATNIYNLAHVASKQAIVAANNISGADIRMDYKAIPEAVFTEPEIGLVGMSEKMCKKEKVDYLVGKFPYMANGKALVENQTEGFIKVIANKKTRKVIGAGLIGLAATDLLSIFANLIANGNTIDEAKDVVYAHPTVSETAFEAILDLDGQAIHK